MSGNQTPKFMVQVLVRDSPKDLADLDPLVLYIYVSYIMLSSLSGKGGAS